MTKHFIRTADWHYINLDFVKSIYYRRVEYPSIDEDAELFEIILDCVESEVSFGFVQDEGNCLSIINDIIDCTDIYYDYFDEAEGREILIAKAQKKDD